MSFHNQALKRGPTAGVSFFRHPSLSLCIKSGLFSRPTSQASSNSKPCHYHYSLDPSWSYAAFACDFILPLLPPLDVLPMVSGTFSSSAFDHIPFMLSSAPAALLPSWAESCFGIWLTNGVPGGVSTRSVNEISVAIDDEPGVTVVTNAYVLFRS